MEEKTTSLVKVEANRKNALKSTGPKDTSLTRLNALKHGILSREVLIKGETDEELEELGKRLRLDLRPQGELENFLVDRIVSSVWRLKRVIRIERDYLQSIHGKSKSDNWGSLIKDSETWGLYKTTKSVDMDTWLNLNRYETTIDRQLYKALHELMRIQSARRGEKPIIPLAVDVDISGGF